MKARFVPLLAALLLALCAPSMGAQRGQKLGPGQTARPTTLTFVPDLAATKTAIAFGAIEEGLPAQDSFQLTNTGLGEARVDKVEIFLAGAGNGVAWNVDLDGTAFVGAAGNVTYNTRLVVPAKGSVPVTVTFTPTSEQYDALSLRLWGSFDTDPEPDRLDVQLSGLGGHSGDPYLHVVIDAPDFVVDYDANGSEEVTLDGTQSHTHEPGQMLIAYEWHAGAALLSTDPITSQVLSLGSHDLDLTIYDDGTPQRTLTDSATVEVLGAHEVPGVLALYYDASGVGASTLLDAVPADADFGEILETTAIAAGAAVGSSQLTLDTMVRMVTELAVTQAGDYDLIANGGVDTRVELGGVPFVGPMTLAPGTYAIEARFAIDDATTDLPVSLYLSFDGGKAATPDPAVLTHDQSGMKPVVNSMPTLGIDAGGNVITIDGLGFFPNAGVTVHWGGTDLTENDFSILTPGQIEFMSPPGSGTIQVTVETPNGLSKVVEYQYSPTGPVPVLFELALEATIDEGTAAVWGPDRRLYVIANTGELTALTFDDTYTSIVSQTTYPGVSGLTNHNALGITFNPFDPPSPVRLYVGHGEHFLNGGSSFTGPSDYTGQVSILEGPDFDTPVPLITGLPTSNHDHAVNGLAFDHNGDLFVSVGSNTNAGVRHPNSGDVPESPLSAAVLKARTSKPGFNGVVTYTHSTSGLPSTDQVEGEMVDVDPGVDVEPFALGLRNPFGVVYTTAKRLYATDNGPNFGFGAASTGPITEDPDPYDDDEINLLEHGVYYGSPNRARGRYDARQNVYRGSLATGPMPSIPGEFRQMTTWTPPASCGLDEYRSNTFQGQIRGWLIVQEYLDSLRRVKLSADGRAALNQKVINPWTGGLGVVLLPGGVLASINYGQDKLQVLTPDDLAAVGLVVHDVFPWRAPSGGGYPFTIAGVGFGNLVDTSVTFDGLAATLTRVSATRIEGTVPLHPAPTKDLVDVVVTVDTQSATLADAFRFLPATPGLETGDWGQLADVPDATGEVAAGVVDGVLLLVGEPNATTYRYDLLAEQWLSAGASRPFVGHHHAAEVVDGQLYLIGGLDGGSEGKLQIYDPVLDSWSTGADMPWAAGSVNTCTIDGLIYAAAGIVGSFTVNNTAVYDPELDSWTPLAAMPDGRNHAAAGTDGSRFWIFGGRKGGNFVSNGFDQVFVYDPVLDSWESSDDVGSSLVALPQARGGMGKAVWYQGEFWMFGGETLDGPGATVDDVYDRVDVYDPAANSWRLDEPMPTPRHGHFPVLFEGRMFLAGGGLQAGFAQSDVFEVVSRQ